VGIGFQCGVVFKGHYEPLSNGVPDAGREETRAERCQPDGRAALFLVIIQIREREAQALLASGSQHLIIAPVRDAALCPIRHRGWVGVEQGAGHWADATKAGYDALMFHAVQNKGAVWEVKNNFRTGVQLLS
jgi:hypothetical protein